MVQSVNNDKAIIMWQTQEDGAPEEALLLTPFFGCFTIENGKTEINVNYESIDDLIKALKKMKTLKK